MKKYLVIVPLCLALGFALGMIIRYQYLGG